MTLTLIAGFAICSVACGSSAPFNISLLPFIPLASQSGLYEVDVPPVTIPAWVTVSPAFSIRNIPLNSVQIPFGLDSPLSTDGITSAIVQLSLHSGVSPEDSAISATIRTFVSFYLAPGSAPDRFASEFKVPLGLANLGTSASVDLAGNLGPAQLAYLAHGTLLVGIEFADTSADVSNTGASTYYFDGMSWQLTGLRIRGTAELPEVTTP